MQECCVEFVDCGEVLVDFFGLFVYVLCKLYLWCMCVDDEFCLQWMFYLIEYVLDVLMNQCVVLFVDEWGYYECIEMSVGCDVEQIVVWYDVENIELWFWKLDICIVECKCL